MEMLAVVIFAAVTAYGVSRYYGQQVLENVANSLELIEEEVMDLVDDLD